MNTDSEEENIENLEKRLRLYQVYRNVGKTLSDIFGKSRLYEKRFIPDKNPLFITDAFTHVNALHLALTDVIQKLPKKVEKPKVQIRTVISLEEMIARLKQRIENQLKLTFKEFTGNAVERTNIIVGFLAVLEMVKQGGVTVSQQTRFHDIAIERESGSIPRYQ